MKRASPQQDQEIFKILRDFEDLKAEYPPQLLAARRAAFIDQVIQRSQVEIEEGLTPNDQDVVKLLSGLKSIDGEYPTKLLTARRSAFMRQVAQMGRVSLWQALRSAIQKRFASQAETPRISSMNAMRTSLIVASLAVAAFVGFIFYGNRDQSSIPAASQNGIPQPGPALATTTPEVRIICKSGYKPPLCLAGEFDKSQDLTYQGNGSARPAVAKDTIPGYNEIHRAANVNDGLYGSGASWVSKSKNSWIKIDLGKVTTINTVAFGRDRLGNFNDRDPGQFVISVALSDDVYADGNSSNDNIEYTQVYDSEQVGFNGIVSGAETVEAHLGSLVARFIKITFENAGTAIDEVEVFMMQSPVLINNPTKKPADELPLNTATLLPTSTSLPTDTLTPVPADTLVPTDTLTPIPTNTPIVFFPTDIVELTLVPFDS